MAALLSGCALEKLQLGQWYTTHTAAAGAFPALDWHFVVDAERGMSGFLTTAGLERVGTLSGVLRPDDSFQMTISETGTNRSSSVEGTFGLEFVTLSIQGRGSACDGQSFRILVVRNPGLEGGGG